MFELGICSVAGNHSIACCAVLMVAIATLR